VAAVLVIRLTEPQGQVAPAVVERVAQPLVTRLGLQEQRTLEVAVAALIQTGAQQRQHSAATAAPVS
jgi:hypothetical protein